MLCFCVLPGCTTQWCPAITASTSPINCVNDFYLGCSASGTVTAINLYNERLSGTLSTAWGRLTDIVSIELGRNMIHNSIPSEFGLLTKLSKTDLATNKLGNNFLISFAKHNIYIYDRYVRRKRFFGFVLHLAHIRST